MTVQIMPTESMWRVLDRAMMSIVPDGARGRSRIADEVSRIIGVRISVPALLSLDKLKECPMRITELGAQVGSSSSTITRQIQDMEQKGLVVRQADVSDGRVAVISLSEKGILAQKASMEVRVASLKGVLHDWPEDEIQLLAPLLERLRASLARGRSDY
jgi:DNA-binding MarR family transcriptional regulator